MSDVCFITDHVAYGSSNKTKIIWLKTYFFLTRSGCVDVSHIYMHAWALGCFHSLIRNKEHPLRSVTKSGRVWRKVPESDAQSVNHPITHLYTTWAKWISSEAENRAIDAIVKSLQFISRWSTWHLYKKFFIKKQGRQLQRHVSMTTTINQMACR